MITTSERIQPSGLASIRQLPFSGRRCRSDRLWRELARDTGDWWVRSVEELDADQSFCERMDPDTATLELDHERFFHATSWE